MERIIKAMVPDASIALKANGKTLQVNILSAPDRFIKDGWTLRNFKTAAGESFEDSLKCAARKQNMHVQVMWTCAVFNDHLERML